MIEKAERKNDLRKKEKLTQEIYAIEKRAPKYGIFFLIVGLFLAAFSSQTG